MVLALAVLALAEGWGRRGDSPGIAVALALAGLLLLALVIVVLLRYLAHRRRDGLGKRGRMQW